MYALKVLMPVRSLLYYTCCFAFLYPSSSHKKICLFKKKTLTSCHWLAVWQYKMQPQCSLSWELWIGSCEWQLVEQLTVEEFLLVVACSLISTGFGCIFLYSLSFVFTCFSYLYLNLTIPWSQTQLSLPVFSSFGIGVCQKAPGLYGFLVY